ncbi:MAG: V-type ATPase subunit [Candidatus Bilamarchaeaceae archaeon]
MFALPKFPKIESRALKYGYANARVKAMKGLLLDEQTYEELIRVKSVPAMIELLQRTSYKKDLERAESYSGSDAIEIAAARSFSRAVSKILRFAPKDDLPAVRALLRKWDLLNIKTILHAKATGTSYERIKPYLLLVGGLTEENIERLARADSEAVFAELKKTDIGRDMLSVSTAAFSRNMREVFSNALKNMNTFLQLESILDAYTYLYMDKGLAEVGGKEIEAIRKVLKRETDAKNVLIVERLKARGFQRTEIEKYFIRGGTLSTSFLEKLAETRDKKTALSLIKTKFRGIEIDENYSLTDLEIALEKSLARDKLTAFHKSILSIGVVLGFVLVKEEEMHNLRKIAKAKEFGIPEDEVKKMLVVL